MNLDEKGRCCGLKPLVYKRDRRRFCHRCDREFDIDTGEQVSNWAWGRCDIPACNCGDFHKRRV